MQIFLTGAPTFEGISAPSQSLGGYISATEVQNSVLSNLFSSVSQYTKQVNKPEYRAIAIYNDGAAALTNLKAYFDYADDDSDSATLDEVEAIFSIGYAVAQADDCGDLYTQRLAPGASPYSITFSTAEGVDNALELPDMVADSYLIIFLKRVVDPLVLTDEELESIANEEQSLPIEENIDLTFSWD